MNELVPIETSQQLVFDWDAVVAETKELIEEDKALEKQQYDILMRRAEIRVRIGFNLLALQAERAAPKIGDFTSWAVEEFGLKLSTIYDCMHVAKRFGDTLHDRAKYAWDVWRELARPSTPETIVEQVESGEISPDPKAIREAKEALKKAEEAEQKAIAKAKLAQQQLFQLQTESQETIEKLNLQIVALQEQEQTISPESQAQINELQAKVKKLTEQRDNLSVKVKELGEEARQAALKRNEEEKEQRIRQDWRKLTKDFQVAVLKMLSQLPSPIDVQIFEADDWERLSQAKELARRFIAECENLSRSPAMIVESGWQVPYAVES